MAYSKWNMIIHTRHIHISILIFSCEIRIYFSTCTIFTLFLPLWSVFIFAPFYPSALCAGGVLSSRSGRVVRWVCGRVRNRVAARLAEPRFSPFQFLWNYLALWLCNIMVICPFAPHGLAHVKFATNWVQTLRNTHLWNAGWINPFKVLYGLV